MELTDPRHGTSNGYGNLGCRCDLCRAAWARYIVKLGHNRENMRRVRQRQAEAAGRSLRPYKTQPKKGKAK